MSILILTGPSAAGKNTVAAQLSQMRERCAVIDVDAVRQMLVKPHHAPWDGDEGVRQQIFGVENACWLARRFADAGYDVLILDVIFPFTREVYRAQLQAYPNQIALLLPERETILQRNRQRGWLPDDEAEMLYDLMQSFDGYGVKIDNTHLSPTVVARQLAGWLTSGFQAVIRSDDSDR